jgi:hypothetical protein
MSRGADTNSLSWEEIEAAARMQVRLLSRLNDTCGCSGHNVALAMLDFRHCVLFLSHNSDAFTEIARE